MSDNSRLLIIGQISLASFILILFRISTSILSPSVPILIMVSHTIDLFTPPDFRASKSRLSDSSIASCPKQPIVTQTLVLTFQNLSFSSFKQASKTVSLRQGSPNLPIVQAAIALTSGSGSLNNFRICLMDGLEVSRPSIPKEWRAVSLTSFDSDLSFFERILHILV